jgi:hypothetical protein
MLYGEAVSNVATRLRRVSADVLAPSPAAIQRAHSTVTGNSSAFRYFPALLAKEIRALIPLTPCDHGAPMPSHLALRAQSTRYHRFDSLAVLHRPCDLRRLRGSEAPRNQSSGSLQTTDSEGP